MWMLRSDMDLGMQVDGSDMDIVSFDDSEQFEEEDSVCSSWISDNDQVAYWSGWKQSTHSTDVDEKEVVDDNEVLSLMELSAKCVAMNYAFEVVEQHNPPIPEALQLRIAFWSFPESEEEIRLYSCLACGSNDKFKEGQFLALSGHVIEVLQIGFHLSGVVTQQVAHSIVKQKHNVSITFDRGHITSCKCSCSEGTTWCEHAIALCIYRIVKKKDVSLRAPVSESLARLERDQLQKFAQYLISELPQQIRTAQKLLDELLGSKQSEINLQDGAPDPTAGASTIDDAKWVLDEASLRENIKKILARCCGCLPLVVVDVNSSFLTSAPPVSLEWSNFIRSFQGHEPEAMWNLLSIVRHMFARGDYNASMLLTFITEECLLCYQMMFYWLSSYTSLQGNNKSKSKTSNSPHGTLHPNNDISRHASAHLMEEVVHLWELCVMMPYMARDDKLTLKTRFELWDQQIIQAAKKGQGQGVAIHPPVRKTEDFVGFAPAIRACELDWDIYYNILGISETLLKELTFKGRGTKLDEFADSTVEIMYQRISSLVPPDMNEFVLVTKLAHSLCCHGFVNKACRLASELARKIICGYPERLFHGETNFASITEKAESLCNILLKCQGNERIVFEVAVLGLTVPRFPAATNMEEVKLSYLEMALYQKLTNIIVTDERLAFIRFQARKLLSNPMSRGDAVLPLIIVTYVFEVLCREHVSSNVLRGKNLRIMNPDSISAEDNLLGYKVALLSLGLCSSTVDHKQPMLCESIRHHRRDLALALLTHCKADEGKIDEIISVILDKERYGFMKSKQVNHNNVVKWSGGKDENKRKANNSSSNNNNNNDDSYNAQDTIIQAKYGFSFGDGKPGPSNPSSKQNKRTDPQTKPQVKVSTDTNTRGNGNHANRGNHNGSGSSNQNPSNHGNHGSHGSNGSHGNHGSHSNHGSHNNHPRRHDRGAKLSSDSDSGHGEGGDKRVRSLNVPLTNSRKAQQQQRRQFRQNNNKTRGGEKSSRNDRASSSVCDKNTRSERASTWVKHNKTTRARKLSKSKPSRELTESDSGQEMHFSFEGDVCPPSAENWDDELEASLPIAAAAVGGAVGATAAEVILTAAQVLTAAPVEDISLAEFLPVHDGGSNVKAAITKKKKKKKNDSDVANWAMSGSSTTAKEHPEDPEDKSERWSMSSPECGNIEAFRNPLAVQAETFELAAAANCGDDLSLHNAVIDDQLDEADFSIEILPAHLATVVSQPPTVVAQRNDNDATSDLGEDDDFNIEADMFHANVVPPVVGPVGVSPNLSDETDELEAKIIQTVLDNKPLAHGLHTVQVMDEKPPSRANLDDLVTTNDENDVTELTTDFSSPDMDDGIVPTVNGDLYFPTNGAVVVVPDDEIDADLVVESKPSNEVCVEVAPTVHIPDTVMPCAECSDEKPDADDKPDTVTNLLQNVLSLVGGILDENPAAAVPPPVAAAVCSVQLPDVKSSNASESETKVQLEDLRVALESVCIEQQPPTGNLDDVIPVTLTQPCAEQPVVKPKKKPKKNKKKPKVSLNMQSIEAEAYSLFELAKSVLMQSRTITNTFTLDVEGVITNNALNRRLQLAAFEIGLFALNVHNYSSPNWFSRTYSSYVSWIENQAVEVGSNAVRCLNEKWEGVLTPSESVQIATRASRSGDSVMRRTAAELALSCLPYSQNLSPVDIKQTVTLCKEQDNGMLERACSAVENAGRNGGVQPELLFHIAREWHYLHEESIKQTGNNGEDEHPHTRNNHANMNSTLNNNSNNNINNNNSNTNTRGVELDPIYMTPEQFVQEQMHQQAQEILGRQLPRSLAGDQFTWIYPQYYGPMHHCPMPQQVIHSRRATNVESFAVPISNFPDELNISEIPRYMQNSYRVGIRALEALTLRMPDERPDEKYALAPPMSEYIRWMCALSAQLGPPYLKIFCKIVYNAVTSPYLLHDLALEAARHFALYNPAQLASHLRSPSVSPIVQKALAMYTELVHYELILLAQPGYPDFVELLRKTRSAFCMAPGGMARFNEILEVVRKSYPRKKELWQLIMNGLSKA